MKKGFVVLILLLVSILLISGCAQEEAKSICGNGVIEAGEGCDGSGCPAGKVCTEKCKCAALSPPALPEE